MEPYPFKFEPIYKEKIWGGRNLERLFDRALPEGLQIGESWELADLDEGASVLSNGPGAGASLTELTRQLGADLLGAAKPHGEGRFPLLLKLLDANDILSLQVHPDEHAVAELGPPAALKTECWYVLESRGGMIYKGVLGGVTADQFRRAIENDTVEKLVRSYSVAAGDFHYLPAGTVHALGAGVVVAEVQTPSDTTYRVTDWGRGRQVHVEQAMRCIHFEPSDETPPGAEADVLLQTDFFKVSRIEGAEAAPLSCGGQGRCAAIMILAGDGEFTFRHAGEVAPVVSAAAGDTVVLPAALVDSKIYPPANFRFLAIDLPE
ncbi:MAG: class I mannose-6-phosphate isomerase [Planctomycetes bacterium]|nr:class I mannose-6-phosphate isomerase [Planctomycetota bacterium]